MNITSSCDFQSDKRFGPQVEPCVRDFDFTIFFEDLILSTLPCAVFLIFVVARLYQLRNKPRVVDGIFLQNTKLVAIALFGSLQLSQLVVYSLNSHNRTALGVSSATLALIDSVAFVFLSYTEHGRSIRPSALLGAFLFFTLILDIPRARTLWLTGKHTLASLFSSSVAMKLAILILEAAEKRGFLCRPNKNRSPEEFSSIFNQSVFYWLLNLFKIGYRKVLGGEDLYPVEGGMTASRLRENLGKSLIDKSASNKKNQLLCDAMNAFKWELVRPVIPRIVAIALTFCQPLMLKAFLNFLDDDQASKNIGYGLIAAYGIVFTTLPVTQGFYYHRVYKFMTVMRGALMTTVYQKVMDLSAISANNPNVMTLMSADIERIVQGLRFLHELWANLISVGIATFLLQQELGAACAAPIIVASICGAIVFSISDHAAKRQRKWMKAIESRVKVTSAMLTSMKGVKMAGLTEKLANMIQESRIHELRAAKQFRQILAYTLAISFAPQHFIPIVTFAVFVIASRAKGEALDTEKMFTSLSLFSLLTQPLSQVFQQVPTLVAAVGCFQRIQEFLLLEKNLDSRETMQYMPEMCVSFAVQKEMQPDPEKTLAMNFEKNAVIICGGSFGWNSSESAVLQGIDLTIEKAKVTLIIGPVASGKSTLLKALLAETPVTQGDIFVETKEIAFCDQTPWLKNDTVLANILGFSEFDVDWYSAVVESCGLEEDMRTFPLGDQTVVGSKGIRLSGGQKQRIAIARAVYSKKRTIILDDVLSGMDATTEHLVSTRLLGVEGILKAAGITVIMATHAVKLLPMADHIIVLDRSGHIVEQGTFNILNRTDGWVKSLGVKEVTQTASVRPLVPSNSSAPLGQRTESVSKTKHNEARQRGDLSVYLYYCKKAGKLTVSIFLTWATVNGFFATFPSIWLKWWTDSNNSDPNTDNGKYLGVYAAFAAVGISALALMVREAFLVMGIKAGINLHWQILSATTMAPITLFFNVDAGKLLNRFTQDIALIDDTLPMAILNLAASFFVCLGTIVLVSTATIYVAICYPVILILLYFVQKFYLRTSRQLRVMDIEAKSPLYTQFMESLAGLATIRAFGWQRHEQAINLELVDSSQQPFYLLLVVQRWLTLVLELISAGLILIITGLAVGTKDSVSTGFTGVSLVNIINLSVMLQSLITWWTVLENSLGAVMRIKTFCESTEPEAKACEINKPPREWPTNGNIEFKNISVSYKPGEKEVLHQISLAIKPREKIAICGRSGSGKSSLILALFRMLELTSGTIVVDDLDLSNIPRNDIRIQLNCIPQDPFFITGTVHLNLDPYQVTTEDEAIQALGKVGLWETSILSLDAEMMPDELSHGQRQLFCLARAILRKGNILVLDEATSSVDRKTDALMQRIIREEFKCHTIIAVAHRLDTILDFDRIVVLEDGHLIECDSPQSLLQKQEGAFGKLYKTYKSTEEDTEIETK